MEGTESKLCTRLTNGLCGNDTDSLTELNHLRRGQVATIALAAHALLAFAGEHRANLNHLNASLLDSVGLVFGDFLTRLDDNLIGMRINDVVDRHTAKDTLAQSGDDIIAILQGTALKTTESSTIVLVDNHIM